MFVNAFVCLYQPWSYDNLSSTSLWLLLVVEVRKASETQTWCEFAIELKILSEIFLVYYRYRHKVNSLWWEKFLCRWCTSVTGCISIALLQQGFSITRAVSETGGCFLKIDYPTTSWSSSQHWLLTNELWYLRLLFIKILFGALYIHGIVIALVFIHYVAIRNLIHSDRELQESMCVEKGFQNEFAFFYCYKKQNLKKYTNHWWKQEVDMDYF